GANQDAALEKFGEPTTRRPKTSESHHDAATEDERSEQRSLARERVSAPQVPCGATSDRIITRLLCARARRSSRGCGHPVSTVGARGWCRRESRPGRAR